VARRKNSSEGNPVKEPTHGYREVIAEELAGGGEKEIRENRTRIERKENAD